VNSPSAPDPRRSGRAPAGRAGTAPRNDPRHELGRLGEDLAARHLERAGYALLDRNWRCPLGELDLVASQGSDLVVAEVKTRAGTGWGHPFEAITHTKLARLRRLAGAWCEAHPLDCEGLLVRIDAIAVIAPRGAAATVEHLRGIG
jgi:putative endonuclease